MDTSLIKDIIHAQTDNLVSTSEHEIESILNNCQTLDNIQKYIAIFDYFIHQVENLQYSDFVKSKATENLYDIIKSLNSLNYFDFYSNVDDDILEYTKKQSLMLDTTFDENDFTIDQYIKELGICLLDNAINPNFNNLSDAINHVQLLYVYANNMNIDFKIDIPLLNMVANQMTVID